MPKNSKKSNPWSGVPGYESVPLKQEGVAPPEPQDVRIAAALRDRYPGMSTAKMAGVLREEMGLAPYKIKMNLNSKPEQLPEDAVGGFYRGSGKLKVLGGGIHPDTKLTSVYHELAHAGDAVVDPGFMGTRGHDLKGAHFSKIPDEMALAQSLEEQAKIERGAPTDPQVVNNMPWLKRVAPLSSNRLANPWVDLIKRGLVVPAEAWNQSYE